MIANGGFGGEAQVVLVRTARLRGAARRARLGRRRRPRAASDGRREIARLDARARPACDPRARSASRSRSSGCAATSILEQMPPLPVCSAILGGFGLLALALFALGPRLFRSRAAGPRRARFRHSCCSRPRRRRHRRRSALRPSRPHRRRRPRVPAALAESPNVILVMVDTLRADHLSCYGGAQSDPEPLPRRRRTARRLRGFSHASWTKPATASLLTSLAAVDPRRDLEAVGALARPSRPIAEAIAARRLHDGRHRLEHQPRRELRLRPGLRRVLLPRARLPVRGARSRRRS